MKIKSIITALVLAAVFILPVSLNAQSDGFFRGGESDNYSNRDGEPTAGIQNNGIGQPEAPLGSGLLILSIVGAGYAIARRKRNLTKGATLLLSALMLLGMTNCRKNLETVNSVPSNGVYITLNVDGGSKVIVEPEGASHPNWATVTWENGDLIYVGNNGAYCGYLTYSSSTGNFGGTITPTSGDDGDYLHFYFMGNKGPEGQPSSVNITDQTSKYPVISYGRSTSLYNSSTVSYEATLYNKCAIVKFNTTNIDKAITITGMMNTVTVDFTKNGIGDPVNPYSYLSSGNGEIRLHAGANNTERWAILLPQSEVTTATAYAVGYTTTDNFTVDAVSTNDYFTNNNSIELTSGSPKGAFTINASGDQVFFAPGNLQYQASTNTWRFAENQWDYVGDATKGNVYVGEVKSSNTLISSSYTGWIDLFGWGTSGIDDYSPIATCYQPWSTSKINDEYNVYGDNSSGKNLYDESGKADWGYAAGVVTLGGFTSWRTLKDGSTAGIDNEWQYICETRPTGKTVNGTNNARYTEATINTDYTGVNGFILFPNSYAGPTESNADITFGTINAQSAWTTKCTKAGWETLEAAGCVFLPAAGYRQGTSVSSVESYGIYWSSTNSGGSWAKYILFYSNYTTFTGQVNRYTGAPVRLVRPVE